MRACVFHEFGGKEVLKIEDIPIPEPKDDEVQVKISYAGVNPVDWKIRQGYLKDVMAHDFPVTCGWDGAGVVTKVGAHVLDFKVGDEVFGDFNAGRVHHGTYGEFAVAKQVCLAKKPRSMPFQVAAALPIAALTAWQALFDFAHLEKEQSVLIHAGSGGVGSIAVQLAHLQGAYVLSTQSAKNEEYVKALGADVCIDYTKEKVAEEVLKKFPLGVDVVFDCVGGDVFRKSLPLVKKGGTIVSIVEFDAERYGSDLLRAGAIFAYPNGEELQKIASLYEKGKLKAPKITEFSLEQAKEAQSLQESGHVTGKLVIRLT